MLSVRPWKLGALLRLGGGIFICLVLGIVVLQAVTYLNVPRTANSWAFIGSVVLACGFLVGALFVLHREWVDGDFLVEAALVLACACLGLFMGGWAQHLLGNAGPEETAPSTMIISVLSLHGAGLVLITAFLRQHGTGWAEAFGFPQRKSRAVLWGIVGWLIGLPGIILFQALSLKWMARLHWEAKEQMPVDVVRNAQSWLAIVVLGLLTVVLVPLVEEVLFRGILYPAIKGRGYPQLALWSSAVAFGAVHGNLMAFLPLTFFGVLLVVLYELTGNLLAPVVTHGLFNAGSFLALVLGMPSDWGPLFEKARHWFGG